MEEDPLYAEPRVSLHLEAGTQRYDGTVTRTSLKMRLLLIFAMSAGVVPCAAAAAVYKTACLPKVVVQKMFRS